MRSCKPLRNYSGEVCHQIKLIALAEILIACSFGVSINEGMAIFLSMEGRYGVTPSNEHYACLMDSLCRDGRLDQALNVAESMPCEPGFLIWESILHSCLIHGDLKLSERAAERLMESEPESSLPYLVLARINEGVNGRLWFELRKPWKGKGCIRWLDADGLEQKPFIYFQGRPVTASPLGNTRIQIYAKVQYYDLKVYSFF